MEPKQSAREFDEGKFIVINKKRFTELLPDHIDVVKKFSNALTEFVENYKHLTGKQMNQRYIVCNLDEPYAERVKEIILGTEESSGTMSEKIESAKEFVERLPWMSINGKPDFNQWENHLKYRDAAIRKECADSMIAELESWKGRDWSDLSKEEAADLIKRCLRAAIEGKEVPSAI
jgi:hypothetical protein